MKSIIRGIGLIVFLGGYSTIFCAALAPVARKNVRLSFPTFEEWSADQRAHDIPDELINEEQYGQSLRKQLQGKHRGAEVVRYKDFMQERGGEEAVCQRIKEGRSIRSRMVKSPVDLYKQYLGQREKEFDQAEVGAGGGKTFAQAHEETKNLPKIDDRVPELSANEAALLVRSGTGKVVTVWVDSSTTLNDIKSKIEQATGIPANKQKIISSGRVVNSVTDLGNITYGREKIHVVATRP